MIEISSSSKTSEIVANLLSNPLFTGIGGFVGGVLFVLVPKFGEGWINEFFENRKQQRTKRIEAAKDINSFVIEGMHQGFKITPGSQHHIIFRSTEIESIDEKVGFKLRQFVNSWIQSTDLNHDTKTVIDFKNDAQQIGNELLEIAKQWSK